MELHAVTVGRLKDAAITGLCDAYVKRSRPLLPLTLRHARDTAAQLRPPKPGHRRVLLDARGQLDSTAQLAAWVRQLRDEGTRAIEFCIGDAHGYSEAALEGADRVWALGRITLPHRLAALVLCEQLYRVATILAGHPYHHE